MNKPIYIAIILLLLSCKRNNVFSVSKELNIASIIQQVQFKHIGGDTLTPDLRITAFTGNNLQYFLDSCEIVPPSGAVPHVERNIVVGQTLHRRYGWALGDTVDYVWVWCQTENIAPPAYRSQTGKWEQNNFVFLESDGEKICLDSTCHSYYYTVEGLIKNGTWVDSSGLLVNKADNYKFQFEPSVNYFQPILDDSFYVYYNNRGYLAIQSRTYDIYFNQFRIPRGYNGKVVFNPTINPEYAEDQRVSHESNYSNNTFLLPVNIQGNSATYDPSAIKQLAPVTNPHEIAKDLKGQNRFVTFRWNSSSTWFCIHRIITLANGQSLPEEDLEDVYNATTKTDYIPNGFANNLKSITYKIYSMTEGLPISNPVNLIVFKN